MSQDVMLWEVKKTNVYIPACIRNQLKIMCSKSSFWHCNMYSQDIFVYVALKIVYIDLMLDCIVEHYFLITKAPSTFFFSFVKDLQCFFFFPPHFVCYCMHVFYLCLGEAVKSKLHV